MRSPPGNAMERRTGAGWRSNASAAATRGADKARIPYHELAQCHDEEFHSVSDSKNLILAVVLSALVLIGWPFVTARYFPPANPASTRVVNGKTQPLPQPQAQPVPATPQALRTRSAVIASTPRVRVETP